MSTRSRPRVRERAGACAPVARPDARRPASGYPRDYRRRTPAAGCGASAISPSSDSESAGVVAVRGRVWRRTQPSMGARRTRPPREGAPRRASRRGLWRRRLLRERRRKKRSSSAPCTSFSQAATSGGARRVALGGAEGALRVRRRADSDLLGVTEGRLVGLGRRRNERPRSPGRRRTSSSSASLLNRM